MITKNTGSDINTHIYRKLLKVIPDLHTIEEYGKSVVPGFMDLNLDVLQYTPEKIIIALSHYYKHPSGDMIADPDMEIAIYPDREYAEALTYQDSFTYQSVMLDSGGINAKLQRELNIFLSQWLANLVEQGHQITNKE
ncbi:DUF1249 domain-containing protein [Nitrosomonas sp. Is24]|uniref:DUF1249 domain-containing protein n=1 Tax=Nitrosomonas sp. Is24 TaxID=3080533 RepID=UPI00294AA2FF|nr:DUF1249 domain-containing protein [Nitrosomonas sp. Is24]MDV6341117.1 DUF1249 domain-containing protein [Nitrosomonas sp. Is24]